MTKKMVLICDIGGTNVRFGLYKENQTDDVEFDGKYKCVDFASFEDSVKYYLSQKKEQPTLCVIGAAGNIDEYNGEVLSTNTPWKASVPKLKKEFPFLKHIRMVNDFALQGWALTKLSPSQYRPLFTNKKKVDLTQGKIVIIGPGTGLGTCLILQDGKHPQTIYTSEAGHSTLPYIRWRSSSDYRDNKRLLNALETYYAHKKQTPVLEHIVSGTGISNIYHALKDGKIPLERKNRMTSEEIECLAQKNDQTAMKTFRFFFNYLGAHTGTMVATTKAENVFFCGGVMASPWIVKQLEKSTDFKEQFVNRAGMSEAMKKVRFEVSLYRDMSTLGAIVRAKHLIETTLNEEQKDKANKNILMSLAILQAFIDANCPKAKSNMNRVQKAVEQFRKAERQEVHPKKIKSKIKSVNSVCQKIRDK